MKKVKCNTFKILGLTYDKVYEAYAEDEKYGQYYLEDDRGYKCKHPKSHFTDVNDIEVGSVWISLNNGKDVKVDYVSDHIVVYGNGEYHASPRLFTMWYKPKPRTVTMYFYKKSTGGYYASTYKAQYNPIAFTREIELP